MSTALAIAIPQALEGDFCPAEREQVELAEAPFRAALEDQALLELMAQAIVGVEQDASMLGEVRGFLSRCELDPLRRALLAMEFSFEIVELELANPGI